MMYGSKTWTITKENEHKLRRFERNVLRSIFGPHADQATCLYRLTKNREIEEPLQGPKHCTRD